MSLPPKSIEVMCEDYKSGYSSVKLSKKYGIAKQNILRYLKLRGIERRSFSKKVNHSSFSRLTPEVIYWVGFLLADGCVRYVTDEQKILRVDLGIKDINHLEKLKSFLGSTHKIGRTPKKCTLDISSKQICNDLSLYGVVPNKSLIAQVDFRLENNRDFWRGVVDGDGSLGSYIHSTRQKNKTPTIQLCGTYNVIEKFCIWSGHKIRITQDGSIFKTSYHGEKSLDIIKRLYIDSQIYLDRKYILATKLLYNERSV